MKPAEVILGYRDAWNSHDASTLVAAFTKDGVFCNPHTHPGGEALAEFVTAVWTAFPDLHFELLNFGEIRPGVVATHWSLTGTNSGQWNERPPTDRSVSIKGASIIHLEGDKIASDQCYFDRAHLHRQLEPKASE